LGFKGGGKGHFLTGKKGKNRPSQSPFPFPNANMGRRKKPCEIIEKKKVIPRSRRGKERGQ